jgi:thioredoxin 1
MPVGYMNSLKVILQVSTSNPNQLIIIDFYAKWCVPCKQLSPILDTYSNEFPDVKFYKTDVEDELADELVNTYQFTSLPTLVYIKNSVEVDRTIGINKETIKQTILKHIS